MPIRKAQLGQAWNLYRSFSAASNAVEAAASAGRGYASVPEGDVRVQLGAAAGAAALPTLQALAPTIARGSSMLAAQKGTSVYAKSLYGAVGTGARYAALVGLGAAAWAGANTDSKSAIRGAFRGAIGNLDPTQLAGFEGYATRAFNWAFGAGDPPKPTAPPIEQRPFTPPRPRSPEFSRHDVHHTVFRAGPAVSPLMRTAASAPAAASPKPAVGFDGRRKSLTPPSKRTGGREVEVRAYTRRNGTTVKPHARRASQLAV